MKKLISMMMIAAVAMFSVACDSDDDGDDGNSYGDMYVGTLSIMMRGTSTVIDTEAVIYVDDVDTASGEVVNITMPEMSFYPDYMPALDMALINIPLISEDPDTYSATASPMVGMDDHLPLINDVVTDDIANIAVVEAMDTVAISFTVPIDTEYMGVMDVPVSFAGVKK